jgi:hypothetical protein
LAAGSGRSGLIRLPWAGGVAGRASRGQSRAHYNHEHLYLLGLTDD